MEINDTKYSAVPKKSSPTLIFFRKKFQAPPRSPFLSVLLGLLRLVIFHCFWEKPELGYGI